MRSIINGIMGLSMASLLIAGTLLASMEETKMMKEEEKAMMAWETLCKEGKVYCRKDQASGTQNHRPWDTQYNLK